MLKHTLLSITPLLILSASAIAEPSNKVKNWVGGIDHLGLTVSDLDSSKVFFTDVLGFKVVGNDATYPACFLSNKKQSLNYGELRMMKNV